MAFVHEFEAAADQFADSFGELVTLRRAGFETRDITAQAWDREYEVVQAHELPTIVIARDYLIKKLAYKVEGKPVEPRNGDVIVDDAGQAWEILPIGKQPAWEGHGSNWLVRSKKVAAPS